jgi:hypothetical protein
MLEQLFQNSKNEKISNNLDRTLSDPTSDLPEIAKFERPLSLAQQKERRQERKQAVIEEFGKPLVNIQLHDGLITPIHVVDLLEVVLPFKGDLKKAIANGLNQSLVLHQKNLRQQLYRESFNFQPGHLLMLITDHYGQQVKAFRDYESSFDEVIHFLNPRQHRLLLVRYFVPPVPDDLRRYSDIFIPSEFEAVLIEIINFCEANFNFYNLPLNKWELLIENLATSGLHLMLPPNNQERSILAVLTLDHGEINYKKVRVHQILDDRVEKQTLIIPYFVLLLAFFCSDSTETNSFQYHYLFSATGGTKQKSLSQGNVSFHKLFNKLLDESLLSAQFNKCLAILFNEVFKPRQEEIEDYLTKLQQKALIGSHQTLFYEKPWEQDLLNFDEEFKFDCESF